MMQGLTSPPGQQLERLTGIVERMIMAAAKNATPLGAREDLRVNVEGVVAIAKSSVGHFEDRTLEVFEEILTTS